MSRRSAGDCDDAGYLLVEILAAASNAGDMLENAKALGATTLSSEPTAGSCTTGVEMPLTGATGGGAGSASGTPVLGAEVASPNPSGYS